MKLLKLAFSFLTVIPVQLRDPLQPGDLGRAAAWYPLVGLALGLLLAGARFASVRFLPDPLGAVVIVVLWVGLTGALHLDGLADCCDGLLASVLPERRLEIMRDPRLGTFGGAGLILFLMLKVSAVMALPAPGNSWQPLFALLLAPVVARWLILLAARQPNARPGGLGAEFALGVSGQVYGLAAILPLGLLVLGGPRAFLAAGFAHLAALGVFALARSRLGGLTGDVLGLTVELGELAVLLTYTGLNG